MPQFLEYFGNPSNFLQGAITASLLAGSFAGSLLTGAFLTDGIGRKKTLLLGSAVFTLGCILAAAAVNLPMLIAGRVVNGLGNGCLTMTVSDTYSRLTNTSTNIPTGFHVPRRNFSHGVGKMSKFSE